MLPAIGPAEGEGAGDGDEPARRETTASATSDGGGFVESVDGLSGGQEEGAPVDWFYYVNGVEANKRGAAATNVRSGDHVWWDRHDWSQTETIPAVVGSFPEPFLSGIEGKRLPVRVECASVAGYACRTVAARLRELDASTATSRRSPARARGNRCACSSRRGAQIEHDAAAAGLEHGPRAAASTPASHRADGR